MLSIYFISYIPALLFWNLILYTLNKTRFCWPSFCFLDKFLSRAEASYRMRASTGRAWSTECSLLRTLTWRRTRACLIRRERNRIVLLWWNMTIRSSRATVCLTTPFFSLSVWPQLLMLQTTLSRRLCSTGKSSSSNTLPNSTQSSIRCRLGLSQSELVYNKSMQALCLRRLAAILDHRVFVTLGGREMSQGP